MVSIVSYQCSVMFPSVRQTRTHFCEKHSTHETAHGMKFYHCFYFSFNRAFETTKYAVCIKKNLTIWNLNCLQDIVLKCHCNEKIFDPILNTTEQNFHTSLNGVFSFSISCFVLEILRFFETCKLGVSDVIYSRIINYTYQMVNISVNSRQKFFKLCMTIAIW